MTSKLLCGGQRNSLPCQVRDVRMPEGVKVGEESVRILIFDGCGLQVYLQDLAGAAILGP